MSDTPGTWKTGVFSDGPEVREYDGNGLRRLVALARDAQQARRIRDALRAAESVPAPPEPLPPTECVDSEVRQYLMKLTGYLVRRCEEVDGDPTDIPEPPQADQ